MKKPRKGSLNKVKRWFPGNLNKGGVEGKSKDGGMAAMTAMFLESTYMLHDRGKIWGIMKE